VFAQKCPGQDMRYWTADDVYEEKCPQCGEMIEFLKLISVCAVQAAKRR
jgi:hypothetical protein